MAEELKAIEEEVRMHLNHVAFYAKRAYKTVQQVDKANYRYNEKKMNQAHEKYMEARSKLHTLIDES